MNIEELREKVRKWDTENDGEPVATSKFTTILDQIEYHANHEWSDYLPADNPAYSSDYMRRLAAWVGNATSEPEQKLLLEYALHISFFSRRDFDSLYQTALNREVANWIASLEKLTLDNRTGDDFHNHINDQIHNHTWYCPITNSMPINDFYKINLIQGIDQNPEFIVQHKLVQKPGIENNAIENIWIEYMKCPSYDPIRKPKPSLNRIVLLEDIVGSGTQCVDAVKWAATSLGKPVLFIPLILCPNGVEKLKKAEDEIDNLTVRPIIQLSRSDLLGPERKGNDAWDITQDLEKFAKENKKQIAPKQNPYGFKSTGCSIAKYSNTPNNSPPMIHNTKNNDTWEPLFPRTSRD